MKTCIQTHRWAHRGVGPKRHARVQLVEALSVLGQGLHHSLVSQQPPAAIQDANTALTKDRVSAVSRNFFCRCSAMGWCQRFTTTPFSSDNIKSMGLLQQTERNFGRTSITSCITENPVTMEETSWPRRLRSYHPYFSNYGLAKHAAKMSLGRRLPQCSEGKATHKHGQSTSWPADATCRRTYDEACRNCAAAIFKRNTLWNCWLVWLPLERRCHMKPEKTPLISLWCQHINAAGMVSTGPDCNWRRPRGD